MTYIISSYTRRRARVLGVAVRRSTKKNKKIDIIKNGKVVASVGIHTPLFTLYHTHTITTHSCKPPKIPFFKK